MQTKRKDFTQAAYAVVLQATGVAPVHTSTPKQLAGRKGGLKGGKTRMASMTDEQRTALAMKGVAGRKKAPAVEAGAVVKKS